MGILTRVTTGISIVSLAACCGLFLLFGISGTGWKALSIPTGSMRPTMNPGTLTFVHRVPESQLKIGDVITYVNPHSPQGTITHRIIETTRIDGTVPGFITKGDANPTADQPIPAGAVVGKVVGHVPVIGGVLMGSRTWVGLAALVYLPALLIILGETQRLAKYWRTMKPYHLFGFPRHTREPEPTIKPKLAAAGGLTLSLLVAFGGVGWQTASALLASNQVSFGPNVLTLTPVTPPPSTGNSGGTTTNQTCTNNNNVNVQNTSNQSADTGAATNTNNTSGGSASSGNATNTNTSNTSISIQNGC